MIEKDYNYDKSLTITTLGNFNVMSNQCNLTDKYNSSLKLWELFKYFITYRDELLIPEKIIDSIWPDADYQDPKRTLRALVFRLRRILSEHNHNDENSIIIHAHGCYKLVTEKVCCIDIIEFEKLFNKAYSICEEDPVKAIELYQKVIGMYKNSYLSESYGHDWLIPTRNYYRRILLLSVHEICELLKEKNRYQEIVLICQTTLKHESFDEGIHFKYIEALAAMGKVKQAKNHYKYVLEIYERELEVAPSDDFTRAYRLLFSEINKFKTNIVSISETLKEGNTPVGPILCDSDFFKFQYQLEKRRSQRYGQTIFLGLLTLSLPNYTLPPKKQLKCAMGELKHILLSSLRKGDIVAQWNESQFIMSLPGLNIEQVSRAMDRVQQRFTTPENNQEFMLHKEVEAILPSQK